jgi:exo-rhamnogalacturonan lyase-like protein
MHVRVSARPGGPEAAQEVRHLEPLTFGVPFPRGIMTRTDGWLFGAGGGAVMIPQVRVLDRWPDGSVRWALVDAQADVGGPSEFMLRWDEDASGPVQTFPSIVINDTSGALTVATGAATFAIRAGGTFPFDGVEIGGHSILESTSSKLTVTDPEGLGHGAVIEHVKVEERGPLRSVVLIRGSVGAGGRRSLTLTARVHFFAGLSTVRVLLMLRNPNRAIHRGGFWDLGDPGSILIEDASLSLGLSEGGRASRLSASVERQTGWEAFDMPFELYQDSSGGENWQSANHVNRERRVPNQFRGYRLRAGAKTRAGLRATPIVSLDRGETRISVAIPHFWQNCPKAAEATESGLTLRLFPGQYDDLHEIQGGEQKTHECFLSFGPDPVTERPLEWCRARSVVSVDPLWCLSSAAVPFLAPLEDRHAALVQTAIEGPDRFTEKRERVDEYGWRHFGDVYGDHETVRHQGPAPLLSHYNNQYDLIAGSAYQFLRSGDARWWELMTELAAHVVDIDIYHTDRDRALYNYGMFWHTYHYGDADTSTHRSYPRAGHGRIFGGGPSAGHLYGTGLVLHHFLTGESWSRDSAIELAQFVIDMDDGRKSRFRWFAGGDTGWASLSASDYYGPGRAAANSLNALMDGLRVTGDARFAEKAEQLIRRVIHPSDDITQRRLDVPEQRWFYTMFLQALGRYLHAKVELGQLDRMYAYSRQSLLHYASWMVTNERLYLDTPEKLEFPTETWAAQDIRKSDVLYFAALHSPGAERERFVRCAEQFQVESIASLESFPTRVLTRPVAVLLTSGFMRSWFTQRPGVREPDVPSVTFGQPSEFVPQRTRAKRNVQWGAAAAAILAALAVASWFWW